jgi:hypothetical protein
MALAPSDRKPQSITPRAAFSEIRAWCQANAKNLLTQPPVKGQRDRTPFIQASMDLIDRLAPVQTLTDLEIRTVLSEILCGKVEWAYHDSDGQYKMAAYAHEGLETAGLSHQLSEEEKENLKKSGSNLLPYFSKHVIT